MTVDRIARLFSAFSQTKSSQISKENNEAPAAQNHDQAVKVSDSLDADANRASRIAQLKEQVAAGNYSPKSEDIAKAVFQDLMV